MMLNYTQPDDYVVATGETHSVEEFVELAFKVVGITDWKKYVKANNPKHMRPAEVEHLIGDASKAHKVLGWKPKTTFPQLVEMMVKADLKRESK